MLDRLADDMDDVRASSMNRRPQRASWRVRSQPVGENRRTGRIRARTLFVGGHLELFGLPSKSPDQVVLAFRPVAKLGESCELRIWRDEQPLSIGELQRRSDHELLAVLRVEELRASDRFVGEACGRSFELDEAGRATVASFASRSRERVGSSAQSARAKL